MQYTIYTIKRLFIVNANNIMEAEDQVREYLDRVYPLEETLEFTGEEYVDNHEIQRGNSHHEKLPLPNFDGETVKIHDPLSSRSD